jgi:hypothetical protein
MRTVIICLAMTLLSFGKVQAQNDPVLTGMIYAYTDKAEKELKNQEKVMLMQTTGHIWMKEEVEGTTNLQREFNNYLNSFRSIVVYAAQVVHTHACHDALWIVLDGGLQLGESDENPHSVIIQVGIGFQRRGITVHGFQVAVVLLFPFVYLVELGSYCILQQCGLVLSFDFLLYLTVYLFVAFCQCHPFQWV